LVDSNIASPQEDSSWFTPQILPPFFLDWPLSPQRIPLSLPGLGCTGEDKMLGGMRIDNLHFWGETPLHKHPFAGI
jgi:hypothetical protein